ncbi:15354_t:CDS:2 [Cetraspora pellucida]|uniref:15354_t:CDS:1 n=1 Tax=Cetraspora pellucida TaxID=1433469 RepID=A0A9N9GTW5_9GLOM|nr:15354_t:CDS:2 [Cetraspora pellucida]
MTKENVSNLEGEDNVSNLESEENVFDLESKDEEDTELAYSLVENQAFESWEAVDKWFELYSQENGFAFCVTYSDHNKVDKKLRHRVYSYIKRQNYVQHKEAYVLDERNKSHKAKDCPYHCKKRVEGDAGSTYLELIRKQCDEPGYYIDTKFEGADNYLLCIVIVIDNHNCSHLVATVVISNEIKETFL